MLVTPADVVGTTQWQEDAAWRRHHHALGTKKHLWPSPSRERRWLYHFRPEEFDHPELMDWDFLLQLDYFRHVCGFPIRIRDDARTNVEHEALYEREIRNGLPYPEDSAHLHGFAVDAQAVPYTIKARATMTWVALEFNRRGIWPFLGLIVETGHHHIDDWEHNLKRPYFGIGVSR